jgi:hypothetical protein
MQSDFLRTEYLACFNLPSLILGQYKDCAVRGLAIVLPAYDQS